MVRTGQAGSRDEFVIRLRIAYLLRSIAEAMELNDDETVDDYPRPHDAQRPLPLSEPLDIHEIWAGITAEMECGYEEWSAERGYL